MQNHGPKPRKVAQKAMILHTFGARSSLSALVAMHVWEVAGDHRVGFRSLIMVVDQI